MPRTFFVPYNSASLPPGIWITLSKLWHLQGIPYLHDDIAIEKSTEHIVLLLASPIDDSTINTGAVGHRNNGNGEGDPEGVVSNKAKEN